MSNPVALNIVRFFLLLFVQVAICNNILLFGFVNPYPYILFILLYSFTAPRWQLLIASFIFGLCVDFFENSGGAHAAACLILAYVRPFLLQTCFGLNYVYQNLKLRNVEYKGLLLYVILCTLIHHSVFFSLEIFEWAHLQYILLQILFSGIFTIIVTLLSFSLFLRKTS